MAPTPIMSAARVQRTIRRLAYEIVERNQGSNHLCVFGIRESGVPLAHALVDEINAVEEGELRAHPLDVTAYRDDHEAPDPSKEDQTETDLDTTGQHVILVDDVLFTGRTARAALDAVLQFGRPKSIQLVVLVDRGHREYPIQPDYVGRRLPTKHRERVVVHTDDTFAVTVTET